jgi:diketogulonate reductase-like aldo/keto reductase
MLRFASLALIASECDAADPSVTLNNGIKMPIVALGTWQYDDTQAEAAIKLALPLGFTHIDTAESYKNQKGVGKAIAGVDRSSYFLTTKTLPCSQATEGACYNQTMSDFEGDLADLQVDYVDLILLHGASHRGQGTCDAAACEKDRGQWKAYQDMYKKGKAKAIGVSNYCISCFECLLGQPGIDVVPAVNQVQYHVGMGDDPHTLLSYCAKKGIVIQAYSPLGNGKLISDAALSDIGKPMGKSAAQVALKWIVDKGLPLATKADKAEYLKEDIDLFSWNLTSTDTAKLSAMTTPAGLPSWACTA